MPSSASRFRSSVSAFVAPKCPSFLDKIVTTPRQRDKACSSKLSISSPASMARQASEIAECIRSITAMTSWAVVVLDWHIGFATLPVKVLTNNLTLDASENCMRRFFGFDGCHFLPSSDPKGQNWIMSMKVSQESKRAAEPVSPNSLMNRAVVSSSECSVQSSTYVSAFVSSSLSVANGQVSIPPSAKSSRFWCRV